MLPSFWLWWHICRLRIGKWDAATALGNTGDERAVFHLVQLSPLQETAA